MGVGSRMSTASRGIRRLVLPVLLAAVTVGASGCGGVPGEGSPTAGSTSTDAGAQTMTAEGFDQWRPKLTQPRHLVLSRSEAEQFRLAWLERQRPESAEGVVVPDLVAWSEVDDQPLVDCLGEQGFQARQADASGSVSIDGTPQGQRQVLERVMWECEAKYTRSPARIYPQGEDADRILFEYYRDFYVPCMEDLGYVIDHSVIPSMDAWVAEVRSETSAAPWWNPVEWTTEAGFRTYPSGKEEIMRAEAACPANPPAAAFGSWTMTE